MLRLASRRQQGQAMIEALIAAALVMVPLFLAIPVIAKYLDIKAYTVQASRYAAWERTVWFGGVAAESFGIGSGATFSNKWDANEKTDDQIRAEIGARLLSDTSAAFSSSDKSGSDYAGGPKQLWRDRRGTTLLKNYGDIGADMANDKAPGLINDLLTPLVNITSVVSNFMVDTKAQYTASVSLSVQQVAFNTDAGLGACAGCPVDYLATGASSAFSAKNVILANGWSANGPGSQAEYSTAAGKKKITVYNQIRGLTPTSLLKPSDGGAFDVALKVLKGISTVFFPELSTLDLGRIEVDRVPEDRLK